MTRNRFRINNCEDVFRELQFAMSPVICLVNQFLFMGFGMACKVIVHTNGDPFRSRRLCGKVFFRGQMFGST